MGREGSMVNVFWGLLVLAAARVILISCGIDHVKCGVV